MPQPFLVKLLDPEIVLRIHGYPPECGHRFGDRPSPEGPFQLRPFFRWRVGDDEALTKQGIGIIALVQASEQFWGEVNFDEPRPTFDEDDAPPPVYVAASIEIGATEDQRLRLETSRMAVIGNARLLDPDVATATNADFVTSAINWVLDREELIGIPPKTATSWQLALTGVQHQNMFYLVNFVLPAAVFCVALVMWSMRRA